MLFNSYGFILLYLPVVLLGFFQLARFSHRYAAAWLGRQLRCSSTATGIRLISGCCWVLSPATTPSGRG